MSDKTTFRALSPVKQPCNLVLPPDWLEIPQQLLYLTSIDSATMTGKMQIIDCIDGSCTPATERVNLDIVVEHVFVHVVRLASEETGEIRACYRTVMVEPNGERVAAVSDGVLKSLQLLASVLGPFPWKPAVALKLQRVATTGGRSRYRLVLPRGEDAIPE